MEGSDIKPKLMDMLACPAAYSWKCVQCGFIFPPDEQKRICSFNDPPRKCPECGEKTFEANKFYPLELRIFEEKDEIVEGVIICPKCQRWYPIRDEIPEMLPDQLRDEKDELPFLKKWKSKFPPELVSKGKPFNLKSTKEKT